MYRVMDTVLFNTGKYAGQRLQNGINAYSRSVVRLSIACLCAFTWLISGCSLERAVDVVDSDGARELHHSKIITRNSAIGLYQRSVGLIRDAVNGKASEVAIFTDELTNSIPATGGWVYSTRTDARKDTYRVQDGVRGLVVGNAYYSSLHSARVTASQARTVLTRLNDSSLIALIAGTYALEGYAILMLAEDYCSGIPLTEVPFEGEIMYGEGLSTAQLFSVAAAKFDSAISIIHDSASINALARIGLGRAYLGLGDYSEAARAVEGVVVDDVFYIDFRQDHPGDSLPSNDVFWIGKYSDNIITSSLVEIVNNEGENGMTWFSDPANLDPRLPVTTEVVNNVRVFPAVVRQQKFTGGTFRFPLARGIEALMIRAEEGLNNNEGDWVRHLNEARVTVGLPPLTDPVLHADRVDILFKERAFWFYMEGVRLGDYRRLVRQYDRIRETVYPIGAYTRSTDGETFFYGNAWVFLTPFAEKENNFRYQGCSHMNP